MKAKITVEIVCKGIYGKETPRTKETITVDVDEDSVPEYVRRMGLDLVERAANGLRHDLDNKISFSDLM